MSTTTILILVLIGLFAGVLAGFVGVGGGIIIVPALIYFLGLTQHQAQATSLTLMLPPLGVLAVYNYYQSGQLDKNLMLYAMVMAVTFVIGSHFGSKISLKMSPLLVKFIFGLIMLYVSIKMIISGSKHFLE